MREPSVLIRMRHIAVACLWAVPLASLVHVSGITWTFPALLVVLAAWTIWRPAAGLLIFALVLPLAFGLVIVADLPLAPARVVESALLAVLIGWAIRAALRPAETRERSRLALPAASMALLVAVSAMVSALTQFNGMTDALHAIWRHLTVDSLSGGGAVRGLSASFRWLEVLALCVMAEQTMRKARSWAPLIVAGWLGAGAAVAAQTVVRVAQATLSRGEGWRGALDVFQHTRFGAIYDDLNAAGSLFALLLIAAVLFTLSRRRWVFGVAAVPVLFIALTGTQSRAAVASALLVFGAVASLALWRRGHVRLTVALAVGVIVLSVPVAIARGSTHVSAGAALSSRVEMWRVSLKMTAEDPMFGVGAGQFQSASRDYLTDAFIASFPEASSGENAHNNFLQVLAEFGMIGLVCFVWLLVAAFRPSADAPSAERRALMAGLSAFLLSALFGHPLLIYDIAVGFFLAVGMMAGLGSAPAAPPRIWQWSVIALVLIALPWRVVVALAPPTPDVVGAALAAAPLDGQSYFVAEAVSRWRLRPQVRAALFPMRWDGAADAECRVRILINDAPADEVSLTSDAWVSVPMIVPPARRLSLPAEVELRVSSGACRLLVGSVHAWR
jgi:hypothetical protein